MITRAKNLDDADIKEIVSILDGWTGKLSWDLLIDSIEERIYVRYTRQALHKHEPIRNAFSLRKKNSIPNIADTKNDVTPEMQVAMDRISKLEAETGRLKVENERLLEQFVRWAYNASTRNLNKEFLNRPLPPVDRDQTPLQKPQLVKATPKAGAGVSGGATHG